MYVSVILPVFNEEDYIDKCLSSILNQDYCQDKIEIIVVDGMSDDLTREKICQYIDKYSNIKLLDNPKKIVPSALNIGIKNAKGELIVRVDAHSEYAHNYISKCVEWSQKTGAENVGGPMRAKGRGYVGKAIEFIHHSVFGLGGGQFHNENYYGYVDTVYLGAFRRESFNRIGLFDTRLARNQDIEFNARLRQAGGKCYLTPEIRSVYYCRSTLKGLWKQNFANGIWFVYTKKIAKHALSLRHFIPLLFVLCLLLTLMMAVIEFVFFKKGIFYLSLPFWVCFGTYLTAALSFSLKIALNKGMYYLPILPIVFFILHFSYGMGSIKGLLTASRIL